jgi:hypothetical protein
VTVLLGLLLTLDRNEWFMALTFGVLIDLDHLFALPKYVSDNGAAAVLRPTWTDGPGFVYKSVFHGTEASFIVGYLSVGWRYFFPFIFWGIHLILDWLQAAALAYSTAIEATIFASSMLGIVYITYGRWHVLKPESRLRDYLVHVGGRLGNPFG